jgi:hypothetical protein
VKKTAAEFSHKLPGAVKLKDFGALIDHEFSSDEMSPDYSGFSHENLVLALVATESPARELVFSLIDRPDREPVDVYEQALRTVRNPSPAVLRMLHQHGATTEQLRLLIRTRIRLNKVNAELRKRFERLLLARAIYRAVVNRPEALKELQRVLRIEKIKSYRENKESGEDLKADAVEASWHKFDDSYRRAADDLRLPEQVVLAAGPGNARLDWSQLRESEVKASLALFLPLLSGELENLREPVRQSLREHFRKWNAAKRTASEIPLFEEHGKGKPLIVNRPGPEETAIAQVDALSFMKIAEEKWGEKGRAFVQALSEGRNMTQAAEAASVSRPTGHKYIRELRRLARAQS